MKPDARELRRLIEAATPCEYVAVSWYTFNGYNHPQFEGERGQIAQEAADYELYAAARNALPWLLARIEKLEAALRGVVRVADRATDEFDAARAALAEGASDE